MASYAVDSEIHVEDVFHHHIYNTVGLRGCQVPKIIGYYLT